MSAIKISNIQKIIIILSLFIIFCHTVPGLAAHRKLDLVVNDQVAISDLGLVTAEDDLLLPVTDLQEYFDVEVEWQEVIKTARIKMDDQVIKLRAGESRAQIGDKMQQLDQAIQLKNDQLLVPVDFIAQVLGYQVEHDNQQLHFYKPSSRVQDINYQNKQSDEMLKIKTSEQPEYEIKSLTAPDRLVIDIFDAQLKEQISNLAINNGIVYQVRNGQFKPGVVRIVLDLYQPLDYSTEVVKQQDGYQLLVKMSPKVTNFAYDNQEERFALTATDEISDYQVEFDSKSDQYIVEIPGMLLDVVEEEFVIDNQLVEQVNLSQIQRNGTSVVRAKFEMKKWFEMDVKSDSKNPNRLILTPQRLVELVDIDYNSSTAEIKISTKHPVEPRVVPLEKGDRLIVDFPETIFREINQQLKIEDDLIEEIRTAQFHKDIARTVIDLEELVDYELKSSSSGESYQTIIKLERPGDTATESVASSSEGKEDKDKSKENKDNQEELSSDKRVEKVDIISQTGETKLQVNLNSESNYKVRKFNYPDRLVIDIPGAAGYIKPDKIAQPQGVIKDVRVSQFSRQPLMARVVFELPYDMDYQVSSNDQTSQIELKLTDDSPELELTGKKIVVDAGHGGADPGAIGINGIREKDVNLGVAQELVALLKEAGAEVKVTRSKDRYITLWSRANMANEFDSDIFVSIHANAHQDDDASGTETFVYPDSYGDTLVLAKTVQDNLQQKIGLDNRGVRFDELYVLEKAVMPSILVEVAFLTNSQGESLLRETEFRKKAAEGIYKGIVAFFNRQAKEDR
ncbi:MAG: N-acetylmuramoyl-L-alanine amidase [Bacillota bacterium]